MHDILKKKNVLILASWASHCFACTVVMSLGTPVYEWELIYKWRILNSSADPSKKYVDVKKLKLKAKKINAVNPYITTANSILCRGIDLVDQYNNYINIYQSHISCLIPFYHYLEV